jgi:hypothetical protein
MFIVAVDISNSMLLLISTATMNMAGLFLMSAGLSRAQRKAVISIVADLRRC